MSNSEAEYAGWVSNGLTQQNQIKEDGVDTSTYPLSTRSTPKGFPIFWSSSKLGNLVSKAHTGLVRSVKEQSQEYGYAYLKMNNLGISGRFDLNDLAFVNASKEEVKQYTLHDGDLIFNTRNSVELVGKCGVFYASQNSPMLFNNNLLRINFFFIEPKIISYWLNSPLGKDQLRGITSATTSVAAIYQKSLMNLVVPVIPLSEQQQIAAKLDELLAQVDSIKTRLDAIPKILKRFRQSVLAAAVSGKLTEDWRNQNKSGLWETYELDKVASHIVDCPHSTPKWTDKGKLCVRTTGFNPFFLDLINQGYVDEETFQDRIKRLKPEPQDILYSREGTVGIACQIPAGVELCLGQRMVLIRANSIVHSKYLLIVLNSEHILSIVKGLTIGSTAPRVNMKEIKGYPIPTPSQGEQTEIIRRVEQLLTYADHIEQCVKVAQTRVNQLTQSILSKAFRGELTAEWRTQNPDLISGENSAEALLAIIQNETKKLNKSRELI